MQNHSTVKEVAYKQIVNRLVACSSKEPQQDAGQELLGLLSSSSKKSVPDVEQDQEATDSAEMRTVKSEEVGSELEHDKTNKMTCAPTLTKAYKTSYR